MEDELNQKYSNFNINRSGIINCGEELKILRDKVSYKIDQLDNLNDK
jgi:hypothetical protein